MTDTLDAIAREMREMAAHPFAVAPRKKAEKINAWADRITALSNQGDGSVAIAEVISGYEFGDSGAESKVRWLLNPIPVGAYLYEQPEAEADRRDAERYRWIRDAENEGPNLVAKYAGKDLDDVIDQYAATQEQT